MGVRSQRALMKNSISQRERYFLPLDVKMIDQLLTLEAVVSTCPVDLCDIGSDKESAIQYEVGECVG